MASHPHQPRRHSPLPTNRAFILQFRADADVERGRFDGRIEHVASGEVRLFQTAGEVFDFIAQAMHGERPGEERGRRPTARRPRPSDRSGRQP